MHLYITDAGRVQLGTGTDIDLPSGVAVNTHIRPDYIITPGVDKVLIVGRFSPPLVWIPSIRKLWVAGITAPTTAPVLATGAAAAINGRAYGKYSFVEIRNGAIVHESNLSPASNGINLSGTGRAWSGLPTTHANARVNYKRLYVSMDGDEYLHVAYVPLASATYTESVLTNALDPLAYNTGRNGPPNTNAKICTVYRRRVFLSDGSDSFQWSEIDNPESYGTTSELKTLDARKITCLRGMTNELAIGTRASIQQVQGFGTSDFHVTMVTQGIGVISHHGSIVVNDKLWLLSQDGYYRYSSGGFQYLMPTLRTYFRAAYEANPDAYEDMVAAIDRRKHAFLALVPGEQAASRTAFFYVGFFLPAETSLGGSGELPDWTFDTTSKYIRTIAALTDGNLSDRLYSGACDGYTRREGLDNTNDDGTPINWYVIHKHLFMGAQDGDDQHAKTFEYLDLYLKSENADVTASVYCGDDSAADASAAQWSRTIEASAATHGNRTGVAKTGHRRQLVDCHGHGASVKIGGSGTSGEYRGFALEWRNEGEQARGSV